MDAVPSETTTTPSTPLTHDKDQSTLPVVAPVGEQRDPHSSHTLASLSRAQLEERVRVSEEWNVRLQHQLQELLQLPRSDVAELRERMQNADIAIPLLQCYDATIAEKTQEVLQLRAELRQLRGQLSSTTNEREGLAQAAQVAEKLATCVEQQGTQQLRRCQAALSDAEDELSRVRQELARSVATSHEHERVVEQTKEECQRLRAELAQAHAARSSAEAALQQQRPLHGSPTVNAAMAEVDGVEGGAAELQRVQLSLATCAKEDAVRALEQLRERMLRALRQSADNHAAHLRVVEERHRGVVEELRNASRTQELEVLKLRAQLARVDPASATSAVQWNEQLRRTSDLLAEQSRQALELELRRVYAELATLQRQRDEAVDHYEQQLARLRHEHGDELVQTQQALQQAQARLEEQRVQELQHVAERERTTQQVTALRERLRSVTQELQDARVASTQQAELLREWQEKHATLTRTVETVRQEQQTALAAERQRAETLSTRVDESLRDLQAVKERALSEQADAERECGRVRRQLQSEQQRAHDLEAARAQLERDKVTLEVQLRKLNEALTLHKRQLASCDAAMQQLQAQVEMERQERRAQALSEERLKIENARLLRARDRLADSLQPRYY